MLSDLTLTFITRGKHLKAENQHIIINKLGYLKDSNAGVHSVDSDIFYVVINLSARSKSNIITFIS